MNNRIGNITLIILLVITIIFTLLFTVSTFNNFDLAILSSAEWNYTGQVGDFIGGVIGTIVSAIGSVLIYMTLNAQNHAQLDQSNQFNKAYSEQVTANEAQRNEFKRAEIESRFFELIKLHKENLSSIVYENEKDSNNSKLEERKAIQYIIKQIESCFEEIKPFFEKPKPSPSTIYQPAHLLVCEQLKTVLTKIDLVQMAQLDIAYSIVFYGTSEKDIPMLKKLMERYYQNQFTKPIFEYITMKSVNTARKDAWKCLQKSKPDFSTIQKLFAEFNRIGYHQSYNFPDEQSKNFHTLYNPNKHDKYYGGHQYKLGHYFRHLYQSVKYINDQKSLNNEQKYAYIKILRAQLSTVEQYLIFYNSLSFMGWSWEFRAIREAVEENTEQQVLQWYFTRYNFIKNIPHLTPITDVNIQDYYPDIHFEFEKEPNSRAALITHLKKDQPSGN